MASFIEAKIAGERAWDTMQAELQVRPSVVGVIRKGDGFALRVTLPRMPSSEPPTSFLGVPVEYRFTESVPELLASGGSWRDALSSTRHKP